MNRSKKKSGMLESYNTAWTDQQRASWQAVGAFIARMRLAVAKQQVTHALNRSSASSPL